MRHGLYRDEPFLQQRHLWYTTMHRRYLRWRAILLWRWLLHDGAVVLQRSGARDGWTTMRDAGQRHLPGGLPTMRLRLPRHADCDPSRGSTNRLIARR